MSRAPHEHLTDNELSNLMNDVDESLGGTAQEYRATAVRGKSHYAELRAAFDQLVKLRKSHDFAKQARVQTEIRETLLAQRDEALRQLQECDRVNAASLATIERLESTLRCLEATEAGANEPDGYVMRLHEERRRDGRLTVTLDLDTIEGLVEARRCIEKHFTEDAGVGQFNGKALLTIDRILGVQ